MKTAVIAVLGGLLTVAGIALLVLPGPGFVLAIAGLAVLLGQVGQAGDGRVVADRGVGPVMVVLVQPGRQGLSTGWLAEEHPGEGPAVGQGAVEALDLAVGLRPVGPGALGLDAQLGAGGAPGVGAVCRAVVAQHAFDGDAAGGEPGRRPAQHADGGGGGLVVVDLGVGHPAVVIEHGVHERGAQQRPAVAAAGLVGRGGPVTVALLAAHVAPAAA